ncbi:MAG TPA: sigma factor-like helix-turn-helix DNA-binding protein [Acidimicrobiales bacterium]|nr:sigma factor-like helix-turn-helix DNA-binding protein [Acidimicrobiales bacterium]
MNLPEEISTLLAPVAADERAVLLARFGLDRGEPRTLQETAEELALDVAEVSRLEASGLAKLRTERYPQAVDVVRHSTDVTAG